MIPMRMRWSYSRLSEPTVWVRVEVRLNRREADTLRRYIAQHLDGAEFGAPYILLPFGTPAYVDDHNAVTVEQTIEPDRDGAWWPHRTKRAARESADATVRDELDALMALCAEAMQMDGRRS